MDDIDVLAVSVAAAEEDEELDDAAAAGPDEEIRDDEEQDDMDEEEEGQFAGKRNQKVRALLPQGLDKKSYHQTKSCISAKKGALTKDKPEVAEQEKKRKTYEEVRVVSAVKGGLEPC